MQHRGTLEAIFSSVVILAGCASGPLGVRPRVVSISTNGSKELISVSLEIADEDLTECYLAVEFRLEGESSWRQATLAAASAGRVSGNRVVGLRPRQGVLPLTVQWDSWFDNVARSGPQATVRLRVTPSDIDGAGEAVESLPFVVDNNMPVLEILVPSVSFEHVRCGPNPSSKNVTAIKNSGSVTLNWTISVQYTQGTGGWLSFPASGTTAPGGTSSLQLSVDPAGLDLVAGQYVAVLTVDDPNARDAPQNITVTLSVRNPRPAIELNGAEPPPVLRVSCVEGQPASPATFSVKNSGEFGSNLTWQIANVSAAWLACSPTTNSAGPLASGSSEQVTVSIDNTGLQAIPGQQDDYTATIRVSGRDNTVTPNELAADKTLTVGLNVLKPPSMDFTSTSLAFPDAIAGVSYPINSQVSTVLTNSGEVDLQWSVAWGTKPAWLEASNFTVPSAGTVLAGGADSDTFTFTVDSDVQGLPAGLYTGSIVFTDQYSRTATVNLSLRVKQRPVLSTSPSSFTFTASEGGTNPAAQILSIWNSNADKVLMNWSINTTDKPSWISLSETSGSCSTETDSVTVSVNIAGLSQGTYSWTIVVSSPEATGSPKSISVTLNVGPPQAIIWVDAVNGTPSGPGDEQHPFKTIGQAMAVVKEGDTIMVKPGTYTEKVVMSALRLTLVSQYGAAVTKIQAPTSGQDYGVTAKDYYGEGKLGTIDGFTICNFERGIYAWTGLNVRNCIIENCHQYGIFEHYAYGARIENNLVRGTVVNYNSGIRIACGMKVYVLNNLVTDNACDGIYIYTAYFEPSYFINNTSAYNGGDGIEIAGNDPELAVVMNNICAFNNGAGIRAPGGANQPTLGYNNVYGNTVNYYGGVVKPATDISQDPKFAGSNDYRIRSTSPCKDAGDNTAPHLPNTDIRGLPRVNGSFVDIGCYEWTAGDP